MSQTTPGRTALQVTQSIATEVAAAHAVDVDRQGRFPGETFAAVRTAGLLGAAVPAELGGLGCGMQELAEGCSALAEACGSSGMVLAMHHVQVACIARHGLASSLLRGYLREVVERQLLLASATSEVGTWGETRTSICAVERSGGRFRLEKDATTLSYGEAADDILATSRSGAGAPASDQVLVLLRKGDYTLTRTTSWDTLGMRGTVSPGFRLAGGGAEEQIVPGSFADSAAQSMVPYSHILWASVWLGIASGAVSRAAASVRAGARKSPGTVPPSALRLAEVSMMLQTFRNNVHAVASEFDRLEPGPGGMDELSSIGWALKLNHLKIAASQMAPEIVQRALQIIGIAGYKNDSPYSVGRHLRDVLSASLMITNDRIAAKTASMLLVWKNE